MPKEFSVKGPIFKLALEHGTDFHRFTPGAKAGKPIKAKAVQGLVDKGVYAWFAYMPINRWTGRETERWRVGVDERSGDYVEFQALRDVDFSNMRDLAAAEAAKASGGKRKPPRALVKELIEAVKKGDEAEVARLAPLAAAGEFDDERPIDVAGRYRKARMVELLLPHCEPNFAREDGQVEPRALFAAVSGGSAEAVQLLLPRCDPKVRSSDGWTALMSAATMQEGAAICALLLPRSDVDAAERREGRTALMMAAKESKVDFVRALAPHAALDQQDAKGRTALMHAIDPDKWKNHIDWHEGSRRSEVLGVLLAAGAKPNLRDAEGNTALLHAVMRPLEDAMELLVPNSDLRISNAKGETALTIAAGGNSSKILRAILDGSDVDHKNAQGDTALIVAARAGSAEFVTELCRRADVNARNAKGRTALMEALARVASKKSGWSSSGSDLGPLRCVLRLLPMSNLDLQDEEGQTALMLCAEAGIPELLGLMLPTADVNVRDAKGATALARLCSRGEDSECFELLLEVADAKLADNAGQTPLMRASDEPEKVRKLAPGSDVDARDNDGATALMHAAAQYRGLEAAKLLLQGGADATLKDNSGRSAEDRARERGAEGAELANLLRDVGGAESFADELGAFIPVPKKPAAPAEKPTRKRRSGGL